MLELLRIRDLALIEDMELEFSPGLNVLTGETGAGKSFILKALNFLTGERLGSEMIRPGKEKAAVEGLFILPDHKGDKGGTEAILRREIAADNGRSRIYLDGSLISQDKIRELRPSLLLHSSQHGQQQLLSPIFQNRILDAFMDRPELLLERDKLMEALKELASRRNALEERAANLADKREMLEFQQQEIDGVAPLAGEEEELESRREEIKNSSSRRRLVEEALGALHGRGGEEGVNLLGRLENLSRTFTLLGAAPGKENEAFQPCPEIINAFLTELREMDALLRRASSPGNTEREREAIEERLYALAQLRRKLRRPLAEILALREEIAANISFLDSCALDLKQLRREEQGLCKDLSVLLRELNAARAGAAEKLARALEEELRGLGFSEHIAVSFAFSPQNLHESSAEGFEECLELKARLLWQPNPGQPPQPLDKIASGGELSRFLLALVPLLSRKSDESPTFIFDEVDAGVGGITLNRVAERLEKLAEQRQLILITHWPQLAARAGSHFQVRKEVRAGVTYTLCERLDAVSRHRELARMAGGGELGEATARELARGCL